MCCPDSPSKQNVLLQLLGGLWVGALIDDPTPLLKHALPRVARSQWLSTGLTMYAQHHIPCGAN